MNNNRHCQHELYGTGCPAEHERRRRRGGTPRAERPRERTNHKRIVELATQKRECKTVKSIADVRAVRHSPAIISERPLARNPAAHREDAEYECNQRTQAQDKHVTPKLVRGVVEERHLQRSSRLASLPGVSHSSQHPFAPAA